MLQIYSISRCCRSVHYGVNSTLRYSTQQHNQNTGRIESIAEVEEAASHTAVTTDEEDSQFEIPKPYIDEIILKSSQFSTTQNSRLNLKRFYAEWKNNLENCKNWSEIWTAPAPFDPHKFPCDIRMGSEMNLVPKPGKYDNMELMKVQNFLHLTPPAIKKHCEGLKKFCTEWPEELKTDEDCERAFPVEIRTIDYVRSGQSQRNPAARKVKLRIRLCNLVLDQHARLKLQKLAGPRYNKNTDILSIKSIRCPVRKQNREYLDYLLTVLYYEAWKIEKWETRENINDEDGIYWWKDSNSYNNLLRVLKSHPDYKSLFDDTDSKEHSSKIEDNEKVKNYRDAVVGLKIPEPIMTQNDHKRKIVEYKEAVRTMLNLPQLC
ncbi:small ribosomal subunit protein mS35-like [Styela clava]